MKTTGVTFGVHTIRATEMRGALPGDVAILGEALVRRAFSVTITPVIEAGVTVRDPVEGPVFARYRGPDKFKHWEFELGYPRWRRLGRWLFPDKNFQRILDHHCVIELWSMHLVDGEQDATWPWIHWLFPSTSWLRNGRTRWTGRSYAEGPRMKPEDFPDDTLSLTDGGFWKTASGPPSN